MRKALKIILSIIVMSLVLLSCVRENDQNIKSEKFDKMISSFLGNKEKSGIPLEKSDVNYLFLYHKGFDSFVNQTCWDNRELSGKCNISYSKSKGAYYECLRKSYSLCSEKVCKGYGYLKDRVAKKPFWQIIARAKITEPYTESFNSSDVEFEAFFDYKGNMLANRENSLIPIPYMRYYLDTLFNTDISFNGDEKKKPDAASSEQDL